ncbi:MAG: hotdog fold thioesterase [Desulfobacteraceae bacterium]|nr:hotdog fold thioesterase [Desulfobacteraceae bacterium]
MNLWKSPATLDQLKERSKNTLMEQLGIQYLEIGDDYLKARMPVDARTKQTAGILHGGASAALAETLGSIAAGMCIDREKKHIVGLEINANHVRPVSGGWVTGITTPVHVGNSTQIWEIRIYNDQEKLVCISRLTVANIDKQAAPAT